MKYTCSVDVSLMGFDLLKSGAWMDPNYLLASVGENWRSINDFSVFIWGTFILLTLNKLNAINMCIMYIVLLYNLEMALVVVIL